MSDNSKTTNDQTPIKKKKGRPFKQKPEADVVKEAKTTTKTYEKAPRKAIEAIVTPIDWEQFEKLCGYQCTPEEIANFFRLEEEQLLDMAARKYKKSFDQVYKIFSAPGLCSLRRSQFLIAKNNATMAIWLGKTYLKQVDPAHTKTEETVDRLTSVLAQIDEETKRVLAQKEDLHGSFF